MGNDGVAHVQPISQPTTHRDDAARYTAAENGFLLDWSGKT